MTTPTTPLLPPPVGTAFKIRHRSPWSGPCLKCNRRRALTRRSKGELPCTDHRPVSGMEVTWHAAVVTESDASGIRYETTERLSVECPLHGTEGQRIPFGGMITSAFHDGLADGSIVLLPKEAL